MNEHTYVSENHVQRERLKALAAKLSEDGLHASLVTRHSS
jgi:hypothetical protein